MKMESESDVAIILLVRTSRKSKNPIESTMEPGVQVLGVREEKSGHCVQMAILISSYVI